VPELLVACRDLGLGELRPILILHVTGPRGRERGRKDLLHHFDVHIMEPRKQFSLTRV
jgi:hypothetical protein